MSILSTDLIVTMVYLIWSMYKYSNGFLGLLGFTVLCFIIFLEVFVLMAATNEAGIKVHKAVAEFLLHRAGSFDSAAYQVR